MPSSEDELCRWTPFTRVGDPFCGDELDTLVEFMELTVILPSGGDDGSVLGLSDAAHMPLVGHTTGFDSKRGRPKT